MSAPLGPGMGMYVPLGPVMYEPSSQSWWQWCTAMGWRCDESGYCHEMKIQATALR